MVPDLIELSLGHDLISADWRCGNRGARPLTIWRWGPLALQGATGTWALKLDTSSAPHPSRPGVLIEKVARICRDEDSLPLTESFSQHLALDEHPSVDALAALTYTGVRMGLLVTPPGIGIPQPPDRVIGRRHHG
jgi:hypothetical protein